MEKLTDSKLRLAVLIFGIGFILVGLLGFVNNPVLGLFEVDTLHNLVHILSGAALVYGATQSYSMAKMSSLVVGVVYALVTLLGILSVGFDGDAMTELLGILHINGKDNYLHLFLTVALIGIGLAPMMSKRDSLTGTM